MWILTGKTVKKIWLNAMIILCVVACTGGRVHAQALYGLEYRVKAGFVYNFAKFIEWPEENTGHDPNSILIGIIPDTPATDVFFSLEGKRIGGKRIEVKKYKTVKEKGVENCHVLFFDSKEDVFVKESLLIVKYRSVLTVGHIKGFTQAGGIINFFTEEGRLRFEVNLDAAKHARIKLGSQILMSAEIITERDK
ncbi:MAG: YfiR family protein [bacterium]